MLVVFESVFFLFKNEVKTTKSIKDPQVLLLHGTFSQVLIITEGQSH